MGLTIGVIVQGMRGAYKIDSLIDTGGLGRVWKARANDGTIVAVKEPLTDGAPDRVGINFDKLRVEAVVLEKLTGPRPMFLSDSSQGYVIDPNIRNHIVRFIDTDKNGIRPNGQLVPSALVMEYVNGIGIDDFRGSKRLDPNRVQEYWTRILKVVEALHENNILHRDISPHNLISTSDPARDPILIDFGTAKEGFNQIAVSDWSQIVHQGYSAPELLTGRPPASPSSDLYSVAATALFMYTGQNPQYLQTSTGDFVAQSSELRRIPDGRLDIIKKCMNMDPHLRYQSAEEVLDVLGGKLAILTAGPYIIASGRRYQIRNSMIIGRYHLQCRDDCRRKGFTNIPDVAVNDPQSYVGRHHARIRMTANGKCSLEDLHAVSGTAVRHPTSQVFEKLQSGQEYQLRDGDLIALAYSPLKGPYMTISYRER